VGGDGNLMGEIGKGGVLVWGVGGLANPYHPRETRERSRKTAPWSPQTRL